MNNIFSAAIALGSIGLILGLLLAAAARLLSTETDERVEKIIEVLPNANCGGCGFAGCGAFAQAVINGEAPPNGCNGGSEVTKKVAEILGVAVDLRERKVAHVNCSGGDAILKRFEYTGINTCFAANRLAGGPTECAQACLGFGDCTRACKFDAIHIVGHHAEADRSKCTGCGLCAAACPRRIIEIVPESAVYTVSCSSRDKGAYVRSVCTEGCIGCMMCVKKCAHGAITVTDNLARIDYTKCAGCGECVAVCPRKIIRVAESVPSERA